MLYTLILVRRGPFTRHTPEKASIADDKCIRCGKCRDECPVNAIKHDNENIPQPITHNME
ncbi:MAG: 4Fe-4S binding protein [Pirellulales bacterium]|nr:4Fe-4S binding protein [Pirellulales bacterium]